MMKCHLCHVQFNFGAHRPKVLPCGHTVCTSCVGMLGNRCPVDGKSFHGLANVLPDNFSLVGLLEEQQSVSYYCVGCDAPSQGACVEAGHPLITPRELRGERVEPVLTTLRRGSAVAQAVIQALESMDLRLLLPSWRSLLDQFQDAEGRVRSVAEPAVAGVLRTLQDVVVSSDQAAALEGGERVMAGQSKASDGERLLRIALVQLQREGRLRKPTAALEEGGGLQPERLQARTVAEAFAKACSSITGTSAVASCSGAPQASEPSEGTGATRKEVRLNLHGVAATKKYTKKMDEFLARAAKATTVTALRCNVQHAWALQLLNKAAPQLAHLEAIAVSSEQLRVLAGMRGLRSLSLIGYLPTEPEPEAASAAAGAAAAAGAGAVGAGAADVPSASAVNLDFPALESLHLDEAASLCELHKLIRNVPLLRTLTVTSSADTASITVPPHSQIASLGIQLADVSITSGPRVKISPEPSPLAASLQDLVVEIASSLSVMDVDERPQGRKAILLSGFASDLVAAGLRGLQRVWLRRSAAAFKHNNGHSDDDCVKQVESVQDVFRTAGEPWSNIVVRCVRCCPLNVVQPAIVTKSW